MDKLFLPCAAALVSLVLLLIGRTHPVAAAAAASPLRIRRYDSIFSFGDSFIDTGNNPVVFDRYSVSDPVVRPPYGSTFFGRPTGRNCDGRLIIDFLAESLGLPFVPPFLAHNGSFLRGANFAVGGATALDAGFYHDGEAPGTGSSAFPLNTSLAVQLQWFESLKPSLCKDCNTTQKCRELFGRSLFFVGPFGYNDYSFLSASARSVQELRSLVPNIIATISMATERLIVEHGAASLVVPGVLPIGCAPPNIVMFQGAADYDSRTGCLIEFNELSAHHNSLLRQALREIQAKHPGVDIIYADFFSPVMEMVESPAKFGFERDVLTICCGGPGNKYHFNAQVWCGDPGATECKDPSKRVFWDGVHMTDAANRHVAGHWLSSINLPAEACSQSGQK